MFGKDSIYNFLYCQCSGPDFSKTANKRSVRLISLFWGIFFIQIQIYRINGYLYDIHKKWKELEFFVPDRCFCLSKKSWPISCIVSYYSFWVKLLRHNVQQYAWWIEDFEYILNRINDKSWKNKAHSYCIECALANSLLIHMFHEYVLR